MSVYMLATIKVHDEAAYRPYVEQAMASLGAFGVEVLAASDKPTVHEGELAHTRIVLLKFPDQAAFDAWYQSPAYRAAKPIRLATSETGFLVTFDGLA